METNGELVCFLNNSILQLPIYFLVTYFESSVSSGSSKRFSAFLRAVLFLLLREYSPG